MARPAIVFIGFMGAGKSTALAAAREAGLQTTEIDDLMADAFGKPIDQAFKEDGEAAFREREGEVVGKLLEEADGGAIALGGGSVLNERVRQALDRHIVVWLQVDAAESWRRIAHSKRPLATSEEDVRELLAARLPLYEELAAAVVPMGDREIVARALPSIQALAELPAATRLLWASSESGEYPIYVGSGLLGAVEGGWWPLSGRRFCITDEAVEAVLPAIVGSFEGVATFPAGERWKELSTVEEVLVALGELGMTREDHVAALGGGVVGDLAGFCAHVYQRGVPVVQLPTTLVAQVDSAYGGKTGVDLPIGKNYAGAYQLPAAVLADTSALASLPRRELSAGFVEVIKTGLLAGGDLWERVRGIEVLEPDELDDVIFACARFKCEVVAADERDGGLRHVLNLGHTVGHGIEAAGLFTEFSHGEAVGLGLLAALRLSDAPGLRDEVEGILRQHLLPTRLETPFDLEVTLDAIERDKKRTSAGVGFVLLSEPGQPRIGQLIDPDKVREAVLELYP
jgi:shikimate kinase / 3-dehydroquinate synthase